MRLGPVTGPVAGTRERLRTLAHDWLATELDALAVGRLCPRCGSAAHGRPWVRVASGRAPSVSIAYAADVVVVAWSRRGVVGVDVEQEDADAGVYGDAVAWTRAEAVLKATGEGLTRDPLDLPAVPTERIDAGPGLVGHVALDQSGSSGSSGSSGRWSQATKSSESS